MKTTSEVKEKWMSSKLSRVTSASCVIDFQNESVLAIIEPDVEKCRSNRTKNEQIEIQAGNLSIPEVIRELNGLTTEINLSFDIEKYKLIESLSEMIFGDEYDPISNVSQLSSNLIHIHDRRQSIIGNFRNCSFESNSELAKEEKDQQRVDKKDLLSGMLILERRRIFHECYDNFILTFIAPHVASYFKDISPPFNSLYYQAFPCLRVVRPGEFSIGIHSDSSYGFQYGNINFYLPFTTITGTNSLVLESEIGKEDWHTIECGYGTIRRFFGVLCSHFTPENTTSETRISIDFRVIPGHLFLPSHDQFSRTPGYYNQCVLVQQKEKNRIQQHQTITTSEELLIDETLKESQEESQGESIECESFWERVQPELIAPDYRTGFPFTKK